MIDNETIAIHDRPMAVADFLIHVDLSKHGMPGKFEQVWAQRINEGEFRIASIPFFPYGICLGDIVKTRGTQPPDLVVEQVTQRSGHRVLRVALTASSTIPELHELIHSELIKSALRYEWQRAEYVSVDLPEQGSETPVVGFLEPLAKMHKLAFEIV